MDNLKVRLSAMGYVTRSRDADDERRVLVSLTPAGLSLRDQIATVPQALFERCREIDPAEADLLRERLVALAAAAESGGR